MLLKWMEIVVETIALAPIATCYGPFGLREREGEKSRVELI